MTNNEMLANIEYLREKADVSYEEAEQLLEKTDGNVMRALVELEQQGRTYGKAQQSDGAARGSRYGRRDCDAMRKTEGYFRRALRTRLIIEKRNGEERRLVANLSVPFALVAALCAPWLTAGAIVLGLCTGHTARIDKEAEAAAQAA